MAHSAFVISKLHGTERDAIEGLVALLGDAVADGASVGFLAPLDVDAARTYFKRVLEDAVSGAKLVWVAADADGVVGTVQLALPQQPNAAHRAEAQRLLVHRRARRRGIGTALMSALEDGARSMGKTLIVMNTRAGDAPEAMYLALGYNAVGVIPRFAQNPDGTYNDTTIMYKQL